MASVQLPSLSLDTKNYSSESNKRFLSAKSSKFSSISLFSCYINTNGACNPNPFCNFNQIRVSRVETEFLDTPDVSIYDSLIENTIGDDSSLIVGGNVEITTVNIWKRYRGVKSVKKYTKRKLDIGRNVKQEEDKSIVLYESKAELYVNFDEIGSTSSLARCNAILGEFEKNDDVKALSFFEWMRINGKLKKNVIAYNLILRVLGRKLDWSRAEEMVTEMVSVSHCKLDHRVFNTIIYACCKRGLSDLGTKWFRMMLDFSVRPNIATFGMLMSLYQKGWVLEEAEFTFSKMRELKIICESAYSAMITIYTRTRLYEKAESVIELLRADKVVLNLENWLVLLNAYCQQGKLSDAERVFDAMTKMGFPPNLVAYNTMITGYGKISRMDRVEYFLGALEEVGLEPDETTYRSLIEGLGRAGDYKQTKLYYTKLMNSGFKPNSSNLYTLLNLQAKNKDDEGAIGTIESMMMIGCQKSSVLGIVLQAYEKATRLDKLSSVLERCLYDEVLKSPTSCTILVTAYVKNSLIDDALKVLKNKLWKDPVFEDNLYHLLICSCKDFNLLENAVEIFTRMPNSSKPNLNIYCTMIDIYGSMGRFSEAENLYAELKSSGVKLDMIAFSVVIRMYVKAGNLKEACAVLEIIDKQKNIVPDVYLLRDTLRIYQRCGMQDKLSVLYYKVLKNSENWDEEMYNCVINCCACALPVDELSRLLDEMLQRGFSPNTITINVMLHTYAKSRLFERARKVFWIAKKRGLIDVISYNTMIAAYGKNKYLKNMSAAVKKMQFDGFSVSLEAYNCMLDVYGKEGEMEKFRSVLERMKASNCASDLYTLNIKINIYGEQGWIDEVADVLMELKENGIRPDLCSYNTLIKAYGIAGKVESAVDLVKEMRENGIEPDRLTYTNLINALRKNDMFLEAVKWSLWMKQMGL